MKKKKKKDKTKAKARVKARVKARAQASPVRKAARKTARLGATRPPVQSGAALRPILAKLATIERLCRELLEARGRMPVAPSASLVHVVELDAQGARSHDPRLSEDAGDRVCWRNLGDTDRTLTFAAWPFTGAWEEIPVPAGETTAAFTPRYDEPAGTPFSYTIDPPPPPGTGPPGGPEVITED